MKQHAVRLFAVLALLCFGVFAFAQSDTARLIGTVTDPTGAAIQGATVSVTNLGTNRTVSVTSNATGDFVVTQLPSGKYRAEVKQTNFKKAVADFTLEVSQVQEINFKLQVGGTSDVVNVTDEVPLIETATSSTGDVIQGRQVTELPLNGRNFTQLAMLTPGVSRGAYGDVSAGGTNGTSSETFRNSDTGGSSMVVNGLRSQANNFILDGVDNNEALVNSIVFFPPAEAIQEFRVNTSVAPAEFGRAGGAIVQTQIKSGTNQIHGSAFWFAQQSAWNAHAYNSPLSPQHRNQFGGTLGGPIWKDKLFAFVDYQGLRQKSPVGTEFTYVPTLKQRNGDFSELMDAANTAGTYQRRDRGVVYSGSTSMATMPVAQICPNLYSNGVALAQFANKGYIYNPQTCLPFGWNPVTQTGTNIIDSQYQNAAGMALINAYPLPNIANAAITDYNFQANRQSSRPFDDYDARIDYVVTPKDTIFARGSMGMDNFTVSDRLVDANHDLPSGWGSGYNYNHPRGLAIGYNHIFTSNIVNEFRFGYTRPMFGYDNPRNATNLSKELGIQAPDNPLLGGIALIGGWGWTGSNQYEYTGDGGLYSVPQKSFQYQDNLTWTRGRHTMKFGVNLIKRNVDYAQGNNAKGYFWVTDGGQTDWSGQPTSDAGLGTFTGNTLSELEAGFMSAYQIGRFGGYSKTRNWETGYYGQDDWRVTNRLTLNLGLRYDLYTWPTEVNNQMSNFDPTTGTLIEASEASNKSLINTDKGNFGPRIGAAYDLFGNGKTVIRGGFGVFYYLDRGGVGNQLANNADFNGMQTYYACPDTTTPGCTNGVRVTLSGLAAPNSNNPVGATGTLPSGSSSVDPKHLTPSANVIYYPKDSKNSRVYQWNLQLERQLDSSTALQVGYVGTHMSNLTMTYNANNPTLGGAKWFSNVGSITEYGHIGSGNYDGLQLSLNRRMSHGLQYTVAYTWSHTLDNAASTFGANNASSGGGAVIVDNSGNADLSHNYGNSDNDLRHVFVGTVMYELPWGKGRTWMTSAPKALDYIIGGWQVNNIVTMSTGAPMSVSAGGLLYTNYNGGCKTGVSEFVWLSCPESAFSHVDTPTGNVGRGRFHGPGMHQWDASIFKTIPFTDRYKMELRLEGINLLNTPFFQNPNGDFGSWDTNAQDGPPHWNLNGNFGKLGPSVGNNTRYSTERHVQLAARFTF